MEIGKENFSETIRVIEEGIAQQLHTCSQVYISQYGEVLASFGIGNYKEKERCTTETIMPWMSCSKMITAMAFALLVERGEVQWSTKVGDVIPEFKNNGKELISFEHILTHTCGLRVLSIKYEQLTWEEIIHQICAMPIEKEWDIGIDAGYHVATSWFILGEAIQRITKTPLNSFIEHELFTPLNMNDCSLAIPKDIYCAQDSKVARFYRTDTKPIRLAVDHYEKAPNICKPGASGRGPLYQLGHFMEMLSEKGVYSNKRLFSEKTIEEMTVARRPKAFDKTFMCQIDWGYGFMVDSKHYQEDYPYSFGPGCSSETFGHNGNQSSAAYVDPENELVVCFGFNGLPGEANHQKRLKEMNEAIYKDLNIL